MPTSTSKLRTLATLALTLACVGPAAGAGGQGYLHPGHAYHAYHGKGYAHPYGMHGMAAGCPYIQSGTAKTPARSLGVMVSRLPNAALDERGLGYGILVNKVQPDSAAAAAGIRAGDLILEYDGKPVYSGERLRWLVSRSDAGKAVQIKLLRDKEPITLNVTPTEAAAPARQEGRYEPRKMGRLT